MVRVLHVTECFDGGTGRAIVARVRSTPEHEHHLVWAGDEAPAEDVGWASVSELPRGFFERTKYVKRAVAEIGPDLVHAHSSWAGVYTRVMSLATPVVYEAHCFKFEDPTLASTTRAVVRLVESRLARRASAIGVLSPHERRLVESFRSHATIVEIPNLPTIPPQPMRAEDEDMNYVSTVGRISAQKDPRLFIAVKEAVARVLPDVRFRWIGDGNRNLRQQLESNGIEVTGWISTEQVKNYLGKSTVYLHTAAYEGFPLSVLDAAACHAPIVVRRISSMQHTSLCMGDSVEQLTEGVVRMIQSAGARSSARKANVDLLDHMSPEGLKISLASLYNAAMSGQGK